MQIITDRRALHRIPELALTLPKTMEYLKSGLRGLNCKVFSPMESALCAYFDFGAADAIAFRADCDALPIRECKDTEYTSCHPGQMHACGHDGHMAILLELARRLSEKSALPHNVLLIFQPGEETPGGAKPLCETGILAQYRVQAIFGLHIWPGLPKGEICSRENELMSCASEVNVDIYGRSSHVANAAKGIDALAAGVEFHRRAAEMESGLPAEVYRLLKFGKFTSGSVRNAISAHTRLEGGLRAFQDDVFESLRSGLFAIGKQIEEQTGCTVEITLSESYPAVMNPPQLCRKVASIAPYTMLEAPSMTAEDFSWYQRYVPGMFFFLGTGDTPALHAADFDFDEAILLKGADFFEKLAENFL